MILSEKVLFIGQGIQLNSSFFKSNYLYYCLHYQTMNVSIDHLNLSQVEVMLVSLEFRMPEAVCLPQYKIFCIYETLPLYKWKEQQLCN